jgi:outer membrane protein TolC
MLRDSGGSDRGGVGKKGPVAVQHWGRGGAWPMRALALRFRRCVGVGLCLVVCGRSLTAGEAGKPEGGREVSVRTITLGEALRMTLRHSPDILRVDADRANRLATATETQLPPNPELMAEYFPQEEELRALGAPNEYDFSITQEFRLSHLGLRQAYASALKDVARMEHQAEIIRVLNGTVLLYYRYWILGQRRRILEGAQQQAQEIAERISTAIESAETPSTEGNLFKAEVERFKAEIAVTQAEENETHLQLLRAMGLPFQAFGVTAPVLRRVPDDSFVLLRFAQQRANLRELVRAQQRAADRHQDVAHLDIFPVLTAKFLYSTTTDFTEPEYGGGVGIRLPLWDWNQAERQRATAEKKVADAEAGALDRLSFDRMIESRQRRAIALQARADTYWREVVPSYEKAYALTKHMFEQGQASMIQLWEVQQKVTRITDEALRDIAEALAARTLLEQALGGKIEEIPAAAPPRDSHRAPTK